MPSFGKTSTERLDTCHPKIQMICMAAITERDFTIICGWRSPEEQDRLFEMEPPLTHLRGGDSKHNHLIERDVKGGRSQIIPCSLAVDVGPWTMLPSGKMGIPWHDLNQMREFAIWFRGFAAGLEVPLRSGYDWDGDHRWDDQRFHDIPHHEMTEEADGILGF